MSRPAKPRLQTTYPPRGMRVTRAAAYLDVSERTFQTLVADGEMPPGIHIRGMVVWDRDELDAAFERFKAKAEAPKRNTVAAALGVDDE